MVLIPLATKYGVTGVLFAGLLAGVILVAAGLLKLGHHIHKLPAAVIEGFSAGIALVIALQQIGWAFGITGVHTEHVYQTAWQQVSAWLAAPSWQSITLAFLTMAFCLVGLKKFAKLPVSMIGLALATLVSVIAGYKFDSIPKIENPLGTLNFIFLALANKWYEFVIPALGIAALGAFEALLSAKIADRLAGETEPHDSDRELVGQGLANLAVPFLGGVPATAALARTAVNVKSGATSRIAAAAHSVFLVVMVLALSPLVSLVPLPALAGVLLATAINMVKFSELKKIAQNSKLDRLLVFVSLGLTVLVDLTSALLVGTLMWLALRKSKLAKGEKDLEV